MTESHRLFLEHSGVLDVGWSALRLAAVARDEGDYNEANDRYTEGRALLVVAGDSLGVAHADAGLGAMAWLAGDHDYVGAVQVGARGIQHLRGARQQSVRNEDDDPIEPDHGRTAASR